MTGKCHGDYRAQSNPTQTIFQFAMNVSLALAVRNASRFSPYARLNTLLDTVRDDRNHPLYSLVLVVGDLIEAYEIDHEPLN
jgi:hypothetical protein